MLSPSYFSSRSQNTRTLPSTLADGPLPLRFQRCAIGDSLQCTQRQGVEAGEIEAEEEEEEVEEDVCDEEGKRI